MRRNRSGRELLRWSPQGQTRSWCWRESPVYGEQENSAYNGHFESTCYHPLLLFNRDGDCLAAKLRPGNVHSAEEWEELLLPEIERQQKRGKEVVFRADAAFAKPEIYEALEKRGVKYAIRIPSNENLQRDIEELLKRPVGRPGQKPLVEYKGFLYQAESWKTARRVVAKVEHHPGELFPRVGFIVTNLTLPSRAVVRFYNKRGTAEQWIKEGKQAVKMTRLSCPVFGLLKRGGRVYTVMIPNARTDTLMPIMERLIQPDSIVYTDGFSSYDALDVSDFHHVRINHRLGGVRRRTETTSMGSRTSGTRQSGIFGASTGCPNRVFTSS